MEKKCKKAKWLLEEALQIAEKRREAKSKGEKERYIHLNTDFQRTLSFLSEQYKEIQEDNAMGKTRDVFKKIRNTKGTLYRGSDYTVMIIIQMQMQKSKMAV